MDDLYPPVPVQRSRFVWTEADTYEFSKPVFVLMITGFMLLGVCVATACGVATHKWQPGDGWLILALVGATISAIAGQVIYHKYDQPVISLLGYAMVAVPYGAVLGPILASSDSMRLVRVFIITTLLITGLGIIGALIPRSLEKYWSLLSVALIVLLISYLILPFFGAGALNLLDMVAIVIFCGLAIVNYNQSTRKPRTLDKAIDGGADNFMVFLNIYLRLAR